MTESTDGPGPRTRDEAASLPVTVSLANTAHPVLDASSWAGMRVSRS
jgi:hypothetical protein